MVDLAAFAALRVARGFAVFAGVTLHGILAGTDSSQPWMVFIYVAASIAVALLTAIRVFARPAIRPARASVGRQLGI